MSLSELIRSLSRQDPEARRLGVLGILDVRGGEAAPLLMQAMADEDWRVRKEAVSVARRLAPNAEILEALLNALRFGDDVAQRNAAVEALGGYGQSVVDRLTFLAPSLDLDGKKLAAEVLGLCGQPSAVIVLRLLAVDADDNVRIAALESLGQLGSSCIEDTTPVLLRALESAGEVERLAALDSLNGLGVVIDWSRLEPLLGNAVLRRSAWQAAARCQEPQAGVFLCREFSLSAARERRWLLLALGAYVAQGPGAVSIVREAVAEHRDALTELVMQSLADGLGDACGAALFVAAALGGKAALTAVVEAAARDDLAAAAERALELVAEEITELLLERIASSESETALSSLELLIRIQSESSAAEHVSVALDALSRPERRFQRTALRWLERAGDERCLRQLAERAASLDDSVVVPAIAALQAMAARHRPAARAIVESILPTGHAGLASVALIGVASSPLLGSVSRDVAYLTQALAHDQWVVRRAALEALGRISDIGSVESVSFALGDEEREVRLAAVRTLGNLGELPSGRVAVERLVALVGSAEDGELIVTAIESLGIAGDGWALGVLRPYVRAGAPAAAVAAVEAVAKLSDSRRVDALIDGLAHPDVEVVKAALAMLSQESDLRVGAHLGACLDHSSWQVRRLVADLLGSIGGEVALGLLRGKLGSEPEPLVREALARALGEVETSGSIRRSTPVPGLGSWRPR